LARNKTGRNGRNFQAFPPSAKGPENPCELGVRGASEDQGLLHVESRLGPDVLDAPGVVVP
jgi:hypothetical protein